MEEDMKVILYERKTDELELEALRLTVLDRMEVDLGPLYGEGMTWFGERIRDEALVWDGPDTSTSLNSEGSRA